MIRNLVIAVLIGFYSRSEGQQLKLEEHAIRLKKHLSFRLKIPKGYNISVAAEGLARPRFFTASPDGRLFVTDMYDRSDNKKGRVLILDKWNDKEKRFENVITYLDNLHNPNQVAFCIDNNSEQYIYVAETGKLSYYKYNAGDNKPPLPGKIIATFPDYGLDYKYGGWHLTRSIAFHNKKLYVSVGSSCNACIEKEDVRASIIEMNIDGTAQKLYASGLRNAVGMKWIGSELWVTNMGRDLIGPDKPEDLFLTIDKNGYYGWPFYFQYKNQVYPDEQFKDSMRASFVQKPLVAPWGFKAHSAPLGFDYFSDFQDSLLNNSFLVALHGSTSVWRQRGNSIVQLMPGGSYREIVTGFLQGKTEDKRFGRPCDILKWSDYSFFISDDKNGVIYYVWKE
jgi:glucose/arabinose dehydrogenase